MKSAKYITQERQIVEDRPCPICGSSIYYLEGYATDWLYSKQSFPLLRNSESGLLITGSSPSEETLGEYYKSDRYISHTNSHQGIINKLYQLARSFSLPLKYRTIARYLSSTKEKGVLLDVGCGTGQFASLVKSKGHQVYCVEQSHKARCYTSEHFHLPCYPSLLDLNLSQSVDVITLWHVLEHINDLSSHFACFRRILKSSGTLVLALPNYTSYDARLYKDKWAAYDVPRHLWHFSPQTIQDLAAKEGFQCFRTKRMPLDAFYIALLSENNKGNRGAIAFMKAFFVGCIGALRSLVKKNESSSLIFFFRRYNNATQREEKSKKVL